jgi:hypothetical protein
MTAPRLVAGVDAELDLRPVAAAERMRQLSAAMRLVAREAAVDLRDRLEAAAALARDVVGMGEAAPIGALEVARRVAGQAEADARSLTAILERPS